MKVFLKFKFLTVEITVTHKFQKTKKITVDPIRNSWDQIRILYLLISFPVSKLSGKILLTRNNSSKIGKMINYDDF